MVNWGNGMLTWNFTAADVIDAPPFERAVSDADIALYALITNDTHPLHIDTDYAAASPFHKRLIPSGLLMGIVESAITQLVPLTGAIIRQCLVEHLRNAYVDDILFVKLRLTQVALMPSQQCCQFCIFRNDNVAITQGEALLEIPDALPPWLGDADR